MIKHKTTREQIKVILFTTLFVVALAYGLSRAYPLLAGAKIIVNYPNDGDIVASTTFEISGKVTRAKEIKIQGKPVTIDTEGNFSEALVASEPYTIIVLEATDKYNGKIVKTLRVIPSP